MQRYVESQCVKCSEVLMFTIFYAKKNVNVENETRNVVFGFLNSCFLGFYFF